MSTDYYEFASPVSSIRKDIGPAHTKLTIFINGAKAGSLTLRNDETNKFIRLLRGEQVARSYYGGSDKGKVVEILSPILDHGFILSEHGDVLTGGDLK